MSGDRDRPDDAANHDERSPSEHGWTDTDDDMPDMEDPDNVAMDHAAPIDVRAAASDPAAVVSDDRFEGSAFHMDLAPSGPVRRGRGRPRKF